MCMSGRPSASLGRGGYSNYPSEFIVLAPILGQFEGNVLALLPTTRQVHLNRCTEGVLVRRPEYLLSKKIADGMSTTGSLSHLTLTTVRCNMRWCKLKIRWVDFPPQFCIVGADVLESRDSG